MRSAQDACAFCVRYRAHAVSARPFPESGPELSMTRVAAGQRPREQALSSIAQQPDSSNVITRTLFVGLAMIESTAIYCFVVAMILLFANPFWNHFVE